MHWPSEILTRLEYILHLYKPLTSAKNCKNDDPIDSYLHKECISYVERNDLGILEEI